MQKTWVWFLIKFPIFSELNFQDYLNFVITEPL
jgi:hypothetical protein